MSKNDCVILGIDPGFAITGYGIVKKTSNALIPISYGCIITDSKEIFNQRLKQIYFDLINIFDKYSPNCVSVENLFFCNNAKTAMNVGQARGVVLLTAMLNKMPVYEFTPLQVKQAVSGYGKANKRQVQQMVKMILNLPQTPKPDDAADALAIAICCANTLDNIQSPRINRE